MFIYFDTCCLQRPLDNRLQARINIEAEAILTILGIIEKKHIYLISSEVLEYEIMRIPDENRKSKVIEILTLSDKYIIINSDIESQAREFVDAGIKPMDALHLASAIYAQADYICTTDDKFLKKAKTITDLKINILSPLKLIEEIMQWI